MTEVDKNSTGYKFGYRAGPWILLGLIIAGAAMVILALSGCAPTPPATPEDRYAAVVQEHTEGLGLDWSVLGPGLVEYGPAVCAAYANGDTEEAILADAASGTDADENAAFVFAAGQAEEILCPQLPTL